MCDSDRHDILKLICPSCKSTVDVWVYHSGGICKIFTSENVPVEVVALAHLMSKMGEVGCMTCGMDIAIAVGHIVYIRPLSVQQSMDSDWKIIK